MIKVQCISMLYPKIEIGKWYDGDFFQQNDYIIYASGSKEDSSNFTELTVIGVYPKKIFITLIEKRDIELNKILNENSLYK